MGSEYTHNQKGRMSFTESSRQNAHDRDHDHEHDRHHGHDHGMNARPHPSDDIRCCADPETSGVSSTSLSGGLLLRIPAMDCASEESQIRRALEDHATIKALRFDLGARTLVVDAPQEAWSAVERAIEAIGMKTERLTQAVSTADRRQGERREIIKLALALLLALFAELMHFLAPEAPLWDSAGMVMAAIAIGLSGMGVYRKGLASLFRFQLGITALMTVAVTGAFLIGQWAEAAMVMALYSLAELIEARAVDRARNAIKGLIELTPATAEVRQSDGVWRNESAATVTVGAIVRVKPGERLALDGRVLAGHSAIDQASVTGESVPVEKAPGDEVFAGTVNQNGSLEFEVTAPASDTVLARIIHAVEQAQGARAPTQRFVDRFAAVYTPAVFIIALAVATLGPLALDWTWSAAVYKALVLLVIACPCALVISTPVTIVSGLAAAARRGILIKGGTYLEEARKLRRIALDKTGTLTEGRPTLVARETIRPDMTDEEIVSAAAGMASRSDHPVSKAIANGLNAATGAGMPGRVYSFSAEPGRGTRGLIDGRALVMGNHRWIEERGQSSPELRSLMQRHEQLGRTVTVMADEDGVIALFAVADAVKPTTFSAIQELKDMGIVPMMLTGDNQITAEAIASEVGIEEVQAGLLPQQKLEAIKSYAGKPSENVGMVGDGINDAPALAAADLGMAMGGAGTHIAAEAADVVIMNDDLRRIPELVRLSRRAHHILWQNITLALGIKLVFLVLAVAGSATMWMAVFADMGASLLVVANGLRLLRGVQK